MLPMVKVLSTGVPADVEPKSVSSPAEGESSPLTIVVLLPWTSIPGTSSSTSTLSIMPHISLVLSILTSVTSFDPLLGLNVLNPPPVWGTLIVNGSGPVPVMTVPPISSR